MILRVYEDLYGEGFSLSLAHAEERSKKYHALAELADATGS